jgi:hypothetical protein
VSRFIINKSKKVSNVDSPIHIEDSETKEVQDNSFSGEKLVTHFGEICWRKI